MHMGHVVNAIYVWGMARVRGGEVLLRIEDHDRVRSRPAFEAAVLEDLDWLGFVPDAGRHPTRRQSDTPAAYEGAIERLRRTHRVYACECSRKEIGGERYDGRCRERGLSDAPGRGLRIAVGPGTERFIDLRLGPLAQTPSEQCGDLLLRDRNGQWTYQLAVTVDDWQQEVTHVIRGEDLVSSTGRQIALARMLGRPGPAVYLHHPLILKASGDKLSKSAGDTGVRELRAAGLSAADVIGRAAAAVDLVSAARPIAATDVAALFR
jgi:glutamyl-tRNA synthetase/glutamyl-Q tRNA(Asp) synthetase